MASNLPSSTRQFIRDMILSKSLTTIQIADAAGCIPRSITIRSNVRQFSDIRAPPIRAGRPRSVIRPMLEALCDHLLEKPGLYLDKMALFLWDEFGTYTTTSYAKQCVGHQPLP